MPARGKQERDTRGAQGSHHLLVGRGQVQSQGFEHIGGANPAAGAAVAVLGHRGPTGRRGEGHGRGNVEAVGAGATGAAGIDQAALGAAGGKGTGLEQHRCHRRQLLAAGPLEP